MARNTKQRSAIRYALEEANRPLSLQEILVLATRRTEGVGISTVYRVVKDLMEESLIVSVAVPGEPARYEVAGKSHHHHFKCNDCDRVFEIYGCPGKLNDIVPSGFQLETHEIFFSGKCPSCAETRTTKKDPTKQ